MPAPSLTLGVAWQAWSATKQPWRASKAAAGTVASASRPAARVSEALMVPSSSGPSTLLQQEVSGEGQEGEEADAIRDCGEEDARGHGRIESQALQHQRYQHPGEARRQQVDQHGSAEHERQLGLTEPDEGGEPADPEEDEAVEGADHELLAHGPERNALSDHPQGEGPDGDGERLRA